MNGTYDSPYRTAAHPQSVTDRYELPSMSDDPSLDDLARLAAQIANTPVACIAVLDRRENGSHIRFLGRYGLEPLTTVPSESFPFDTTLNGEGIYQVPDSRRDPAFSPGGIPLGDRRYRFFAAAPILTPQGDAVGCLCVLDTLTRKLTPSQLDSLEALSHAVTTRLELLYRVRETDRAARARARVESALTVERNFVSAVLDTVGALVIVFDTAGRIVRFNRACEIISGYPSSELVGRYAWERLIPEEDVPAYIEGFERICHGEFPTAYENHWVAADGSRRHISWSATALLDSGNHVAFVIATGLDVTLQRVAEHAIRDSEARYRQIVEGSLGLVCTHDLEGTVLSINEQGAKGLGLTVEDVVGHPLQNFLYPKRTPLLRPYIRELLSTGKAQGLIHLRHRDGERRVLAFRNRLVEPHGEPRYVLAFAVDITEQVRAEEQLRSLMRQSNSVLEAVGDGIFGIDLHGCVTIVNPAAAQMLGYQPEEILGKPMHELIHHHHANGTPYPVEECPIHGALHNLAPHRAANEVFWRKDGTSFPVEYVARPQIETAPGINASGELTGGSRAVGAVVAFTDISERDALDRMKDEFISTVSHELRTPLTSIRAALGLLAGGALNDRPEKSRQMMDIALGNTDRLVRLVNDILDLERIGSGKAELHAASCSVDELFGRATSLQATAAQKANVRFNLEPNDVHIWADPDRILQLLTNLVSNAIKFSPAPTSIPSEIRLTAAYASPDEAVFELTDHGRGIPADKLQQIFERFKQVDASDARTMGGSGLGLAICRSIVTQHGGHIWATSTLGQGSTFHFTLPTRPRTHLA